MRAISAAVYLTINPAWPGIGEAIGYPRQFGAFVSPCRSWRAGVQRGAQLPV